MQSSPPHDLVLVRNDRIATKGSTKTYCAGEVRVSDVRRVLGMRILPDTNFARSRGFLEVPRTQR